MSTINKELIVPYKAQQMYELVNQIEQYPEFLPWCSGAKIIEQNKEQIIANLELSYSGFSNNFTTCNKLEYNHKIIMSLVEGPFKHLQGQWVFTDINSSNNSESKGSKVEFSLDFTFDNPILAMTMGKVFEKIASELVGHFYNRARDVYGSN